MNKTVWRWIGLGAAISLMLVYFIELTSHGLQRMDGSSQIEQAYEQNIVQKQTAQLIEQPVDRDDETLSVISNELNTSIEKEIASLEEDILKLKKQALQKEKRQLEQMMLNDAVDQSNVNKLADTTSGALQQLSSSSMQFVAELFHKVIN